MTDTAKLQAMLDAATPGPWEWGGSPTNLSLRTVHHGKRFVMDFVRKGMSGAQPRFQPARRGMVNADELLQFEAGDRATIGEKAARADGSVYRYDVRGIDAPDARLIAAAPDLAAEVIRLRAALERISKAVPMFDYIGVGPNGADFDQPGSPYDRGKLAGYGDLQSIARAALVPA